MRNPLIVLSLFFTIPLIATPIWKDIEASLGLSAPQLRTSASNTPVTYSARLLSLNETALREKLSITKNKSVIDPYTINQRLQNNKIIDLPLPDKSMLSVIATEYLMMEKPLADKFPQLKTWKVQAANGKNIHGRIDFTAAGFHAMLVLENGDTIFIDPDNTTTKTQLASLNVERLYNSFSKQKNAALFQRPADDQVLIEKDATIQPSEKINKVQAKISNDLITYRLALAATAEYSALSGGTQVSTLSAMLTTINRVNELYERDLAIRFKLIGDNEKLIYLNVATDPFTNGNPYDMLEENIVNMERVIGTDHYDIGHLFGGEGTGGLALLSAVCRTQQNSHKAGGITGSSSPYGDSFNIDYVSHEIGHQLGATHSFNSILKNCSGGNREEDSAVEPGSGSSVMSYAGICDSDNLQPNSDAVFNARNIEQVDQYIRYSGLANCGQKSASNNNNPSINDEKRFTIPSNTPFLLSSYATDIDADTLTYTWDQIDSNGTAVQVGIDAGDNPLFRSYLPTQSNQRYFPQLSTLFGGVAIKGETLPVTNRNLTFATSVRDNQGGIARTDTNITVSGTQFKVTSQTSSYLYHLNEKIEVKWNEAGTSWAPVNCNYVDIKLLTVDGISQPLLLETANDGSQSFTIPKTTKAVTKARIMVACSDNIFFALSQGKIAIQQTQQEEDPIARVNSPIITEGDSGTKNLNYIITLNKATTQAATIRYSIRDINEEIQLGIVNIALGKTHATITQVINGDLKVESDQSYQLTLSSPQNISFPSTDTLTTTGTVLDNDSAIIPTKIKLTINDISVLEGNSGITQAVFSINLDQASTTDINVNYATIANTALAGSDFSSQSDTLHITAGQTNASIIININTDQLVEGNENFQVVLSNPSENIILINTTATATILNDDNDADKPEDKDPEEKAAGSFNPVLALLLLGLFLFKWRFRKALK
jgi:hypothetical protein